MARLSYLTAEEIAPEHRELLAQPIALPRLLAHSPGALRAFSRMGAHIRHGSRLDPRLRELAILQVGYVTGSEYEFSHHVKLGLEQFGVREEDLRALVVETRGEQSDLPELDRAVLRAAREMTFRLEVSDATFERLRRDLDEELLVELVVAIAFYNAVVRILESLRIDVEPEYLPFLERFPLPASEPLT